MAVGVITGDIIKSTEIQNDEKEKLYYEIDQCLKKISKEYKVKSEWYRGDAFQIKVQNVKYVCRIAFIIKSKIKSIETDLSIKNSKSFDARIAIGIGTINFEQKTLAKSDGEAFQLSGRALDYLKNTKYNFIINSNDPYKNSLNIESQLLDIIFDKHTPPQSKVIYYKLHKLKEEEVAKKLAVAQSTVNQHSNAANWNVIHNYLEYFETLYQNPK